MDTPTRPAAEAPTPSAGPAPPPLFAPATPDAPPPAPRRSRRLPATLAALGVAGAAAFVLAGPPARLWSSRTPISRAQLYMASKTSLPVKVEARGSLESSRNLEVINRVEGQTMILFIVPDGSVVKEGELVCELDSSGLREKLTNERITVQQAEADLQNATKSREVAEFSLREYEGGTYPQTRLDADITLSLAERNLDQAAERFDWSTKMHARGFVAKSQTIADRDAKANTEISLDRARTSISVLEGYTKRKKVIELKAAVQKARSDEINKEAKLALERSKQKKYEAQVERCKLYAPAAGLVVHANDAMGRRGSEQGMIQEGMAVREGQVLIRIPDVSAMRVDAKVDEAVISRVRPGQRARIRVDAFPGLDLRGPVVAVQPIADPTGRDNPEIRLYTAKVGVEGARTSLRPGMAARVEILVSEAEDLLAVPMKAVLQVGGENFVYVAGPDGLQRRGVRLGASNDDMIEVAEGLREGEEVSLVPMSLMTERERREAFAQVY